MFRFKMCDTTLPIAKQKDLLKEQFSSLLKCDAMSDILSVLNTDLSSIGAKYDVRKQKNGIVRELQDIKQDNSLEKYRYELYPLFQELGFININTPTYKNHSHIIVLGGSLNSCHKRTSYVPNIIDKTTLYIDGLACYRPINPAEKKNLSHNLSCDTEFSAMTKAFIDTFSLENADITEAFVSNRNINSISNIRTFVTKSTPTYKIWAAPSGNPDKRRANTADTLKFYMDNNDLSNNSSVVAVTGNINCNRQFIQLVYEMLSADTSFNLDVVGYRYGDNIEMSDNYKPSHYVQELIALINWINKFNTI